MLTEKYRPKNMEDIYGMKKTISVIKEMIKSDEKLPHMVFYGPEGTGKTVLAECIQNELDADMLELNASDERGIDVIRNKVNQFTKMGSINEVSRIVFLDEAEALTKDAQNALRRIMEKSNASFILCTNHINKIIKPLVSRNAKFQFEYPDTKTLRTFIGAILQSENINSCSSEVITKIATVCKEYRASLNMIEKIQHMSSVTVDDIESDDISRQVWNTIQKKSRAELDKCVSDVFNTDPASLIDQLADCVVGSTYGVDTKRKAMVLLAEADARIATGASGKVQIPHVIYSLSEVL